MPHDPNKNNNRWIIPDQLTSQEKHERFALHFPAQLTQINLMMVILLFMLHNTIE